MPLLTVDQDLCDRDGRCRSECPFGLITESTDGFPEVRPAAARLCINCGHCLAVCPTGALSMPGKQPSELEPTENIPLPAPDMVINLVRTRRSIRNYQAQPVPREIFERIIDAARWAPSAKNSQPVHWLVVESAAEVKRLAGLCVDWLKGQDLYPGIVAAWGEGKDMVLRSAPHLIIAHAHGQGIKPDIDCTIALATAELVAHSLGVGTCWAGIFMGAAVHHPPLIEALDLPEGHKVFGALTAGYPQWGYPRIPDRKKARITWR